MKKFIDLDDMVNHNCSNVLNIIQKNGSISRKQITQISGLSWGGMTKIVNKLLENGYIVENKPDNSSSGGRIPGVLSINTTTNYVVGLDINKTGLHAIVMDLTGEIIKSFSSRVDAETRDEFIKEITDFTEDIFAVFQSDSIISIGIAMQGIVDYKKGISVRFPDIADWENIPLKDIMEQKFGVSVFLEHDPDCLLYSHMQSGSKDNIVLMRMDKSIGMAAAVEGKIIKGKGILEVAHNILIPDGKQCRCGERGCFEAYVYPCIENDKINMQALEELILPLSIMIKNAAGMFDASKVILTGALMEYKEHFYTKLLSLCEQCCANIEFSTEPHMAVKGAALIAVNKSINSLII